MSQQILVCVVCEEAVVRNQRKSTVGTVIQKAIMKLGFLRRPERSIVRLMVSSVENAGKNTISLMRVRQ